MVAVKRLIVVICHKQRRLEGLQQTLISDVGIGVVNEGARLDIAVGVDMKIIPSARYAAVDELAVVLKIYGEYRLCLPVLPYLFVHLPPLLRIWKKLHRRVISHRHVMEIEGIAEDEVVIFRIDSDREGEEDEDFFYPVEDESVQDAVFEEYLRATAGSECDGDCEGCGAPCDDKEENKFRFHPTQKPLKLFEMILRDYVPNLAGGG